MLMKLLKYDMKSMLKTILPLWFVALVVSVVIGTSYLVRNEAAERYIVILFIILFAFFVAISVVNVVMIVQRFWNGLLKDEGYLMFTLPASPRSLILSKLISASIITAISTIVGLVCLFIITSLYTFDTDFNVIDGIRFFFDNISGDMVPKILLFGIAVIFGGIQKIYVIYAAMAIGQLTNKNRFLASILAFVGLNSVISIVSTIFFDSRLVVVENMQAILPIIVLCIVLSVILHIITEYILSKRLNLE